MLDILIDNLKHTTWYEYAAVFLGILSVWFSKKENVLVYPTGILNTLIYVYISYKGHLLGEAFVNFYFTVMSIIGWYMWTRKDANHQIILHVTFSNKKDWILQIAFFITLYVVFYFTLAYFKKAFFNGVIPWADALGTAAAFTGMALQNKKKVESWVWWILTDAVSVPLYYVKGYALSSIYFGILLLMAISGLQTWYKKAKTNS